MIQYGNIGAIFHIFLSILGYFDDNLSKHTYFGLAYTRIYHTIKLSLLDHLRPLFPELDVDVVG